MSSEGVARRSCLSVPASEPAKLAKAHRLGADEVVYDLEDPVTPAAKPAARAALAGPSVTLTEGLAAAHQATVGCRLPLALDRELSQRVLRSASALAYPALVWDVAIGQSTIATHTVTANLFYPGGGGSCSGAHPAWATR
ncbi:aldolase/citrate lyase family protein [Dactylosporangium sp. CA-092794]|uniref:aldolase/citrate lyase family protein n=1 Tax=Dactylosporangium sp. CA-092794 TaxID=3239929 RepID=UPI003D90DBA6